MADLKTVIEENAAGPAQASGDGQSVTQHNIKDLIEADTRTHLTSMIQR
jgi:hypothetical protein